MPSLKELRNRIASVKATQKITKAMQMVAAAKLRRAQTAAEAARPYATRMETVLANLAAALQGREGGPPLMIGTGKDAVHLLIVCTAERGLCGAFNSAIVRLAREHINRLLADGKQVKILCVGKKGFDQLKRQFAAAHHRGHGSSGCSPALFRACREGRRQGACAVRRRRLRRGHPVLFPLPSVISQVPTAQQIIPATFQPKRRQGGGSWRRRLRIRAGRGRHPGRAAARSISPCRFSRPCSRMPPPSRARA